MAETHCGSGLPAKPAPTGMPRDNSECPVLAQGTIKGETMDDGDETAPVTVTVNAARPVQGKAVFALVDVEVQVAGVSFGILGVQARREPGERTSVRLPTFKDADGAWRPAVRLPPELAAPIANAVLNFLVEEGLAKPRFEPVSG